MDMGWCCFGSGPTRTFSATTQDLTALELKP
jgi:hypothetical protein